MEYGSFTVVLYAVDGYFISTVCSLQVKKMDLEARSLPPNVKSSLLVKLREYKSDLNNFKTEVKRITSGNLNATARDELLEAGMADTLTVCRDLFNTSILIMFLKHILISLTHDTNMFRLQLIKDQD